MGVLNWLNTLRKELRGEIDYQEVIDLTNSIRWVPNAPDPGYPMSDDEYAEWIIKQVHAAGYQWDDLGNIVKSPSLIEAIFGGPPDDEPPYRPNIKWVP